MNPSKLGTNTCSFFFRVRCCSAQLISHDLLLHPAGSLDLKRVAELISDRQRNRRKEAEGNVSLQLLRRDLSKLTFDVAALRADENPEAEPMDNGEKSPGPAGGDAGGRRLSTVDGAFLLLCLELGRPAPGPRAPSPRVLARRLARDDFGTARVLELVGSPGSPRGDGVFMACFQDKLFRGPPYAIAAEDKVKTVKLVRPCGSSRTRPRRRP